MTVIECERCGSEFDTEREHKAGEHADTLRCPKCGKKNEVTAENQRPVVSDGGKERPDAEIEVTLTIQIHGGEVNVHQK